MVCNKQYQHLACADRRCRSENSFSCAVSREVNRHHTAYASFLFSFFKISREDPRVFLLRMSVHISAHFLSFPYERSGDTRPLALGGTVVGKGAIIFSREEI